MSITDELRKWIDSIAWLEDSVTQAHKNILAIADRIDERYSVKVERLEKYRAAVDAMLKEYIKLPVDADGVPIRVGDKVTRFDCVTVETIESIEFYKDGWWIESDRCGGKPENIHHVQPDSWEQIIEDALHAFLDDDAPAAPTKEELVKRCRRLAGEAE